MITLMNDNGLLELEIEKEGMVYEINTDKEAHALLEAFSFPFKEKEVS